MNTPLPPPTHPAFVQQQKWPYRIISSVQSSPFPHHRETSVLTYRLWFLTPAALAPSRSPWQQSGQGPSSGTMKELGTRSDPWIHSNINIDIKTTCLRVSRSILSILGTVTSVYNGVWPATHGGPRVGGPASVPRHTITTDMVLLLHERLVTRDLRRRK